MTHKQKLQYLLISNLMKDGEVQLILPDGITLSLGITKDSKNGIDKDLQYCWLTANQDDKSIFLDSRNLDFSFSRDRLIVNDEYENKINLAVI
jgi:hypothetical protein